MCAIEHYIYIFITYVHSHALEAAGVAVFMVWLRSWLGGGGGEGVVSLFPPLERLIH